MKQNSELYYEAQQCVGKLSFFACDMSQFYKSFALGVLDGGRFLKCEPIGQTTAGLHIHLSFDPTHHGTRTKYGHHLRCLVGQTHSAGRPLLIINCPALLRQISIGFVWVECYSR